MNFPKSITIISLFFIINSCAFILMDKKVYSAEDFVSEQSAEFKEKIKISSIAASIQITSADQKQLAVKLTGKKPKEVKLLKVIEGSKELEIKIDRPKDQELNNQCDNLHLTITLPEKQIKRLEIETVSGDLELAKIKSAKFHLKTVSGDVGIKNLEGEFNIKSVSGDISLEKTALKDSLGIKTVSGDISLVLPEKLGFALEYQSVSGDIDSDFAGKMKSKPAQRSYSFSNGDKKVEIELTSVSGDLTLKKDK